MAKARPPGLIRADDVAAGMSLSPRQAARVIAGFAESSKVRLGGAIYVPLRAFVDSFRAPSDETPLDRQRRLTADRIELELQARRGELIDVEEWQRLYGVAMSRGLSRLANQLRKFGPAAIAAVKSMIEEVASEIDTGANPDGARGAAAVSAPDSGHIDGARDDSAREDQGRAGGKREVGGAGRARRRDQSALGTARRGHRPARAAQAG